MGSGVELGSGPEYHIALVAGYLPRPELLTDPFFRDAKVVFEIEKEEMEWQARPPRPRLAGQVSLLFQS